MDIETMLNTTKTAAISSGKYLLKNFGANHKLQNKNNTENGLYSKFDIESSNIIIKILAKQWNYINDSELIIISEETDHPIKPINSDHGFLLEQYFGNIKEYEGYCWVIDPICGSIAYARGIRDFIISIALVKGQKAILAVVYDPCHDELFHAVVGKGAFLNDMKIIPSDVESISEAIVSLEHKVYRDSSSDTIKKLANSTRRLRTAMTCALEMCYVACGRIDAVIKLDQAFYDYIGGALILSEALQGKEGLVNIHNNKNVLPYSYLGYRQSFVASNGLITNELLKIIHEN